MPKTLTALTNGASVSAQTNIKKATGLAQDSANRISKGLKIDGDAAAKGIYTKLNAKVLGNEQVASNLSQGAAVAQVATGDMDQLNEIITRVSSLAIQSNSDTVSETERAGMDIEAQQQLAQFDNVLNTVDWLGVKLLKGSAGSSTLIGAVANPVANGIPAVGGGAGQIPANTFAGTINAAATSGNIQGAVTAAPIITQTGTSFNVSLQIGSQTFTASGINPNAGGVMTLKSGDSTLSFDYAAGVGGLNNLANFQAAFDTLVGWNANQSIVTFQSQSAAPANGMPAAANGYIAGSTVTPGMYAISYDGAGSFKLIDPTGNSLKASVTAGGAQTITFSNGFNFAVDNTFNNANAIPQVMVQVNGGANTQLSFQSDTYGGSINVTMPSLDRVTLGLNNVSLKTKQGAIAVQPQLEAAMNVVSQSSAQVVAVQKRLELAEASATTARENLIAARASVGDTDLAKETTEFTKYNVLSQAGIAMKTQADQMFNSLLAMVRG
ncbi:Flagellin domain protein [Candidatus Bealeia paramacronuclearis]|uniref:Flagellin n=1 Tax=Candidatus Bealeia paramacronuclearis TaxID=1921001 RepID=A0ABZ2C0F8_9PROT|nr:Flagellin domain protein [Candidatus Bealeia paramacronuclearis]